MTEPDPQELINSLLQTKVELEKLQGLLLATRAKRELSVSEEERLRQTQKAIRKLNQDYLPWTKLKPDRAKAAEISLWLYKIWFRVIQKNFGG